MDGFPFHFLSLKHNDEWPAFRGNSRIKLGSVRITYEERQARYGTGVA
jgi:hypothetical protein